MTIILNGQTHQTSPDSTVADLLQQRQLMVKHVAVEVNLEIVPRSRFPEQRLHEGDRVEVVTLVGGG